MSEQGQLVWAAAPQKFEKRPTVEFSYSPVLGFSDIDFHPVTTKDWSAMKAPAPDAVGILNVAPELTMRQLQDAVAQLRTRGGYTTVEIVVR